MVYKFLLRMCFFWDTVSLNYKYLFHCKGLVCLIISFIFVIFRTHRSCFFKRPQTVIRAPHMISLSCNTVAKQYRSDLGIIWRHDCHLVLIFRAAMKARTFVVCWNLYASWILFRDVTILCSSQFYKQYHCQYRIVNPAVPCWIFVML